MFAHARPTAMSRHRRVRTVATVVVAALSLSACGGAAVPDTTEPTRTAPATAEPVTEGATEASTSTTAAVTVATVPEARRVDLATPTFSEPTLITNQLFPITETTQVIQVGAEAGDALHIEITLLPETRVVEWDGQAIDVVVSQFVAYLDGRILEVAVDFFAQADDGSVWYFGEEVDNYEDGAIANHDGTWLAGRDGPAGMIMPAQPRVDDAYRPENIPNLVFEEVVVAAIDETAAGPGGPVRGAVLVVEHLLDGTLEDKLFAPGYGEFMAQVVTEDELVTLALAIPIDARGGGTPVELVTALDAASEVVDAVVAGDGPAALTAGDTLTAAWEAHRGEAPELLASVMDAAVASLTEVIEAGDGSTAAAALAVVWACLDLQLQYRPPAEVDTDRLVLWLRRLAIDAADGAASAVVGDVATLETIWQRVAHTFDDAERAGVVDGLLQLRKAVAAGDLAGAGELAAALTAVVPATGS